MNKGRRVPPITWSHEGFVGLRSGSRLRLFKHPLAVLMSVFPCVSPVFLHLHAIITVFVTNSEQVAHLKCLLPALFANDRDKRQKAFCKQFWHHSCLNWRKRDREEAGRVDESGEGGIMLARRWNKRNYFNKGRSTLLLIIFDLSCIIQAFAWCTRFEKQIVFLYGVFVCFGVGVCVRALFIQMFICRVWIGVVCFINGSIVFLHQQPFQSPLRAYWLSNKIHSKAGLEKCEVIDL